MYNEKELKISTWAELQDALYHDSWAENLNRFRSGYVYRGVEDASFELSTSLNRLGESQLERHLLRNFRKYSQLENQMNNSIWNWLALAQHHGLPTRLLDWTYSPYVALHFATADFNNFEKDGAIWAINYVDTIRYLPDHFKKIIDTEGSHIFTAEMLDRAAHTLDDLQNSKEEPFTIFLEPPSMDQRIVNQYAVFSMMSNPDINVRFWLHGKHVKYF